MASRNAARPRRAVNVELNLVRRLAWITGLWSLAVAEPILQAFGRDAAGLVARGIGGGRLVGVAFGLSLGLPLLLAAVVESSGLFGARVRSPVHGVVCVVLLAALLLPLVGALPGGDALAAAPLAAVGLCGLVGVLLVGLALRWAPASLLLTLLAAGTLVVPMVFLTRPGVSRLAFGDERSGSWDTASSAVTAHVGAGADLDVVLVVLDELPLDSLLAADGGIDATLFPAFARLAATSTWYRNATASHDQTAQALPAILSGRAPDDPSRLPVAVDHPGNLFAWLAPRHRLLVAEPVTDLFRPDTAAGAGHRDLVEDREGRSSAATLAVLAVDMAVVWAHRTLPAAWSSSLPAIDTGPAGFLAGADTADGWIVRRLGALQGLDHSELFEDFIDALPVAGKGDDEPPLFAFLHVLLPHQPWEHLPSGRRLARDGVTVTRGQREGRWDQDPDRVHLAWQRHLLQLGATDRLLGRLLDRLEQAGRGDRTLLVVLADHGLSFVPGGARRKPADADIDAVRRVPYFVRMPGQTAGAVSERNVQTVDTAPSIADWMELAVPPGLAGVPLDRAEAPATKVMHRGGQTPYRSGPMPPDRRAGRDRRLALFGAGVGWDGVYGGLGSADVLGRALDTLPRTEPQAGQAPPLSVALTAASSFRVARRPDDEVPAYVEGRLWGRADGTDWPRRLVFVLDEVVVGATRPAANGSSEAGFALMLDERRMGTGPYDLSLYAEDGAGTLHPLRLERWTLDAGATRLRDARGREYELRAAGPMGAVEVATLDDGERLRLAGWAADLRAAARVRSVVVMRDDQELWSGPAAEAHLGLARRFDDPALQACGFVCVIPVDALGGPVAGRIRVYAVGETFARELDYEAPARWLRP